MDFNSIFNQIPNLFSSDGILNFIFNPEFTGILLFVKIIFIIISAVLVINIFYLFTLSSWFTARYATDYKEYKNFKSTDAQKISQQWEIIDKRVKTNKETELKLAVIEAEESLINMLKMTGNNGEVLEDQLNQAGPDDLSNIKDIMEAHRFRNEIINNPDKKLDLDMAKKSVEIYKNAFEELQA